MITSIGLADRGSAQSIADRAIRDCCCDVIDVVQVVATEGIRGTNNQGIPNGQRGASAHLRVAELNVGDPTVTWVVDAADRPSRAVPCHGASSDCDKSAV